MHKIKTYSIPLMDGGVRGLCSIFRNKDDLNIILQEFIEGTFTTGVLCISKIRELISFEIDEIEYYTLWNKKIETKNSFFSSEDINEPMEIVEYNEFLKVRFNNICYKNNQNGYTITTDEINSILDLSIIENMKESLNHIKRNYLHEDFAIRLEDLEERKQSVKYQKKMDYPNFNSFNISVNLDTVYGEDMHINECNDGFTYTNIVGNTPENRGKIKKNLSKGQELQFLRTNKEDYSYDSVKICTSNSDFIGYLPMYCSMDVAKNLDELYIYDVKLEDIIINQHDDVLVNIKFKRLDIKRPKHGSKKNRSDEYDYNFYVGIADNEGWIYNSSTIEIDRRIGGNDSSSVWNDGEIITIPIYIKPIENVVNALTNKYLFEEYNGIPEKEKEAVLKGLSIAVEPEGGTISRRDGELKIDANECLKLVLDYREAIYNISKQNLESTCKYVEKYDYESGEEWQEYTYYLIGNLSSFYIDESEGITDDYDEGYSDYLSQRHEDEYNLSDRDSDIWSQGDINEYYGYERDYDGDIDY